MKHLIRRFVFGIVTLPIVFTIYALLYAGVALITDNPEASWKVLVINLPAIAFGYLTLMILLPQVIRLTNKLVTP